MNRPTASAATTPAAPPASALDTALLVGLVTLTCVRLLLAEVFVRPDLSLLTQALAGVAGPTPATTAWLDGVTLLLAVAAFARRGLGGGGWRIYWAATGLLAAVRAAPPPAPLKSYAVSACSAWSMPATSSSSETRIPRVLWIRRARTAEATKE